MKPNLRHRAVGVHRGRQVFALKLVRLTSAPADSAGTSSVATSRVSTTRSLSLISSSSSAPRVIVGRHVVDRVERPRQPPRAPVILGRARNVHQTLVATWK